MEYQEEMVEMESQGEKERGETLVYQDHLDHEVHTLNCISYNHEQ